MSCPWVVNAASISASDARSDASSAGLVTRGQGKRGKRAVFAGSVLVTDRV